MVVNLRLQDRRVPTGASASASAVDDGGGRGNGNSGGGSCTAITVCYKSSSAKAKRVCRYVEVSTRPDCSGHYGGLSNPYPVRSTILTLSIPMPCKQVAQYSTVQQSKANAGRQAGKLQWHRSMGNKTLNSNPISDHETTKVLIGNPIEIVHGNITRAAAAAPPPPPPPPLGALLMSPHGFDDRERL
ncbi:hypothetical protein M0804_012282 [Polistes exclamans]|nr:hypothetical protein M0804_012282 [Polistes exclamans]